MADFQVLGPIQVLEQGEPIDIGGPKPRTVVALLTARVGKAVSSEALIDALWGESVPDAAANTLQSYVSRLRKVLGSGTIVSTGTGYQLDVADDAVDARRFESLVADARVILATDATRSESLLDEALDLWRGHPFEDAASAGDQLRPEVTRLEELRLQAIEYRIEAALALGRHEAVVGDIEAHLVDHPWRERLWGHLMIALYRSGRQGEALRAFQRAQRVLGDDLGIEPSPELRRLEEQVLLHDTGLLLEDERLPSPTNLPLRASSFIGREAELEAVQQSLTDHRLATITGVGGVGKTSLAIESARAGTAGFPDGVWLAELGAISEPEAVPGIIARTVGAPDELGRPAIDSLRDYLASRRMLLVLDNCEHVIEGAAEVVGPLLAASDGLKVLATSRERLRVSGETVLPLAPLDVPAVDDPNADSAAVRLFAERCRQVDPAFTLAALNLRSVAEICTRLDGIPLAIELAAARGNVLSPEEIALRLGDRFRLLTSGERDAPPRHQALEATIAWSYDLLPPAEALLFDRLAVFAGTFDLEAAEAVCSDEAVQPDEVLDLVTGLVEKSMVERVESEAGARYRLLESIRQFATERLEERGVVEPTKDHQAAFYVSLVEGTGQDHPGQWPFIEPNDEERALLRVEHDNLRAAIRWSYDTGDVSTAARIAGGLWVFWHQHMYWREAQRWYEDLLAVADRLSPLEKIPILHGTASLAFESGDSERAERLLREEVAVATQLGVSASRAYNNLGGIARERGDWDQAAELYRRSIAAQVEYEDGTGWAPRANLADALLWKGDIEGAEAEYEASINDARRLGESHESHGELGLARIARVRGDQAAARSLLEERITTSVEHGLELLNAYVLLACVACDEGRLDESVSLISVSVEAARNFRSPDLLIALLWIGSHIAAERAEWEEAATFLGAASQRPDDWPEGYAGAFAFDAFDLIDGVEQAAEAALAAESFQACWIQGSAMTYDEAVWALVAFATASER